MPAVETKPDLDALIRKVEKMSPMGNTVQKALSILNDASFDAVRLAGVMRLDETMTGMVLRLANSAYYAPAQRISDITRAVAYLGQSNVKQLLLSASVSYLVRRPLPGYGFGRGELWTHAVGVAAGARYLAAPLGHSMAESAYTAGLLADIGMLALDSLLQERSIPNLNVRAAPTLELEREYLGVDHATLGAEIANRWNLPPLIIERPHRRCVPGEERHRRRAGYLGLHARCRGAGPYQLFREPLQHAVRNDPAAHPIGQGRRRGVTKHGDCAGDPWGRPF